MELATVLGIIAIIVSILYALVRRALFSLTAAIAILFIFMMLAVTSSAWGRLELSPGFYDLALVHFRTWRYEEIPQFFTSMFVHQNLLHLGFNMLALIFIGVPLEDRVGTPAFIVMFFFGGLMGSMAFYLIHYNELYVLLGASGAIAAELGMYARLYPRQRVSLFFPGFLLPPIPIIWVALGFLVLSSLMVFIVPNVAHESHIAGLIFGFALAPLIARLPSRKKETTKTLDIDALEQLAVTPELKDMVARIRSETVSEVREAWLDRLVKSARCPKCGGPLMHRSGKITSDCGWSLRFR